MSRTVNECVKTEGSITETVIDKSTTSMFPNIQPMELYGSKKEHVCHFPCCQNGTNDMLTWINELTGIKIAIHRFTENIQSTLMLLLMCGAVFVLSLEVCTSFLLLEHCIPMAGFEFIILSFIGVVIVLVIVITGDSLPNIKEVTGNNIEKHNK